VQPGLLAEGDKVIKGWGPSWCAVSYLNKKRRTTKLEEGDLESLKLWHLEKGKSCEKKGGSGFDVEREDFCEKVCLDRRRPRKGN